MLDPHVICSSVSLALPSAAVGRCHSHSRQPVRLSLPRTCPLPDILPSLAHKQDEWPTIILLLYKAWIVSYQSSVFCSPISICAPIDYNRSKSIEKWEAGSGRQTFQLHGFVSRQRHAPARDDRCLVIDSHISLITYTV